MKVAVLLLFALTTLVARADDLAGHYVLHMMEVGSELLLKSDGTFEFGLIYGAADYWAKGTWHRDGNAVILESSGKEEPPFRLLRTEAGKEGRIRVLVVGAKGKGVANVQVLLLAGGEEPLEAITDSDGAAVFPDEPKAHAVAFEISVYQIETPPFEIDPAKKDFYFEINGEAITQVLFKNERLTIDGSDLVMKHFDSDRPMRYEKE